MRAPKVEVKEDPVLAAVEKRNQENDYTSIQKDVQGQTSQLGRFATTPATGSQAAPIMTGYPTGTSDAVQSSVLKLLLGGAR
ncbi:hypothetical protein [Pleomorphomonas sp. JP5]|uniref:hypothetical protein n=1 Tax=Pleomorphomonas sp. JP5 TaxID=2942998 RepID=UPI002044869C|nr:hypothetical protein [Pleomorphomonas sp. JP5]MCM5558489.1 hypothetical protein [Pleomorphomonas sp. JP5]